MLIKKDKDVIASYLEDYSNLKGGFTEGVAIPETESEIINLLKEAGRKKTPVFLCPRPRRPLQTFYLGCFHSHRHISWMWVVA